MIIETGFEIRLCDHLEAQYRIGASMDAIRNSFFRPLDWRRDRARELAESGRRPSPTHDDAATRLAVRYFRAVRSSPGQSRARGLDDVRRAEELAAADGPVRTELDARILAGQSDAEIAARLPIPERVVSTYEALHFNVRDRLQFPGWVICRVLGHGREAGVRRRHPVPDAVVRVPRRAAGARRRPRRDRAGAVADRRRVGRGRPGRGRPGRGAGPGCRRGRPPARGHAARQAAPAAGGVRCRDRASAGPSGETREHEARPLPGV